MVYRRNASSFAESGASTNKFKSDWPKVTGSTLHSVLVLPVSGLAFMTCCGQKYFLPGLTKSRFRLSCPVFKKNASRFQTRRQLIFIFGWSEG
jgi:hypothetical protein